MEAVNSYLKKHTEALVKDVGLEAACTLSGKSKTTLGRYYSDAPEHADRFMPVDVVAAIDFTVSGVLTAHAEVGSGDRTHR